MHLHYVRCQTCYRSVRRVDLSVGYNSEQSRYIKIRINTPVKLKSFLGIYSSPEKVDESEDFWKLIGHSGTVIEDILVDSNRVLVRFDKKLADLHLANHNPINNSLMIQKSDLELDRLKIHQLRLDKEISIRTSYMNNTKWFKLFNEIKREDILFRFSKIKFLLSEITFEFSFDNSDVDKFDNFGFMDKGGGPFKFKEIEWISIPVEFEMKRLNRSEKLSPKIITQPIEEIEKLMNRLGQFEYLKNHIELKIYGYK